MISGEKIAKEKESVPINTPSFLSNPIQPSPPLATLYTHLLGSYKRQLDVQKSVVLSLL